MVQTNYNPFEDFPIQYKQLNVTDFPDSIFDEEKTLIEEDNKGYISENLQTLIDFEKKDTTVINASVGQGKTVAIIQFVKYYFQQTKDSQIPDNYVIVIATPSKALIKQYKNKIRKESGHKDIVFDYRMFESVKKFDTDVEKRKPIQLFTVNSLLGNPGENAPIQSENKRKYTNELIAYCKENDKKVIFIYDEIHESINNFKEQWIFNLWKWKDVVHKIIIASATFNEASKVVIKYLAELTDNKIRILESERNQRKEILSNLHLCFTNNYNNIGNNESILNLIKKQSAKGTINILTATLKLAKDIVGPSAGGSDISKFLKKKYGEVNLCTSQSRTGFKKGKCNIGTNFKTGISIEEDNTSYFVFLPPPIKGTRKVGIFTDGVNSIIQAFARPRKNADIFIIMPPPEKLIIRPFTDATTLKSYVDFANLDFLNFNDETCQSEFYDINEQDELFCEFYNSVKADIENEIELVKSSLREHKPSLRFPDYNIFKLELSEKKFVHSYDVFGKNLSNYVYWNAINNQFINCKLKSIYKVSSITFQKGMLQRQFDDYYSEILNEFNEFDSQSDKEFYSKFRNSIYSNKVNYISDNRIYNGLKPYDSSHFEKEIITFVQRHCRSFNLDFAQLIFPNDDAIYLNDKCQIISKDEPVDYEFPKEQYLLSAIGHSVNIEITQDFTENEKTLINAYRFLNEFRQKLKNDYSVKRTETEIFLYPDNQVELSQSDSEMLNDAFNKIKTLDSGIRVYNILQDQDDKSMYRLLKGLFFKTFRTTATVEGNTFKASKITEEYEMKDYDKYVQFVFCNYPLFTL